MCGCLVFALGQKLPSIKMESELFELIKKDVLKLKKSKTQLERLQLDFKDLAVDMEEKATDSSFHSHIKKVSDSIKGIEGVTALVLLTRVFEVWLAFE